MRTIDFEIRLSKLHSEVYLLYSYSFISSTFYIYMFTHKIATSLFSLFSINPSGVVVVCLPSSHSILCAFVLSISRVSSITIPSRVLYFCASSPGVRIIKTELMWNDIVCIYNQLWTQRTEHRANLHVMSSAKPLMRGRSLNYNRPHRTD